LDHPKGYAMNDNVNVLAVGGNQDYLLETTNVV